MDYTNVTSGHARKANCHERDMELVKLYNETLKLMIDRNVKAPRRAALHFVIHNGHPRYYVSYKRAYEVVCQLLRHGKTPKGTSLQAQMWQELAERVQALCQGGKMSIACAVEFVLEHCRASRFFMTEDYADTIIDRARKEFRRHKLHSMHNS